MNNNNKLLKKLLYGAFAPFFMKKYMLKKLFEYLRQNTDPNSHRTATLWHVSLSIAIADFNQENGTDFSLDNVLPEYLNYTSQE